MRLEQLETPALILDMDTLEEIMGLIKSQVDAAGIVLRPHYKSHKSTAIAQMQIKAGAKGITCAKLGEAEDLVFAGIKDVLIANQITEPVKLSRIAYLANCCKLTVCADHIENIKALEAAAALQNSKIHCLIEYEIGMNRCGVETPEQFLALAKEIESSPHLVFEGVQAYAGNLAHEEDYNLRKAGSEAVEARLGKLLHFLKDNGLPAKEVSGASTGTVQFRGKDTVYTEIQAGSYLFMDAAYNALNLRFKSALFVAASVMSIRGDLVIADAGRKAISVDQKMPVLNNHRDLPLKVSEEHSSAIIKDHQYSICDRLLIIPGHCCTTVNLHDYIYLIRGGEVEDRIPVTSRGKGY